MVTQQPSTKLEEGIVGIDGTSNQPDTAIFQNIGRRRFEARLVLQDRTVVCWLNVAGDLVRAKKGKIVFLARSMWNHVICVRSHNR